MIQSSVIEIVNIIFLPPKISTCIFLSYCVNFNCCFWQKKVYIKRDELFSNEMFTLRSCPCSTPPWSLLIVLDMSLKKGNFHYLTNYILLILLCCCFGRKSQSNMSKSYLLNYIGSWMMIGNHVSYEKIKCQPLIYN